MLFRKRIRILPGVNINLSKTGISTTVGPKGFNVNTGKKGSYLNTGLPGTGLYNRNKISSTASRSVNNYASAENNYIQKNKSKTTAALLCFFFGLLGMHRFYTGHTLIAIIQMFTFGGLGLWVLIDFILIITGYFKDSKGNLLVY
jgi:hypothetical protein